MGDVVTEGETPLFLVIKTPDPELGNIGIDLDEPGWAKTHKKFLRAEGLWELFAKPALLGEEARCVFRMLVLAKEQPYYNAKTIGIAGDVGSRSIKAYGIGKKYPIYSKKVPGKIVRWETMRLWVMPDGSVCGGNDESDIARGYLYALGPQGVTEPEEQQGGAVIAPA